PLPTYAGEAESRLAGLRLAHTHLKPGGLSSSDLTTLFLNRLDALVAIDVDRSRNGAEAVGTAQLATVAPSGSDAEDWIVDEPQPVRALEKQDVLGRVRALEEELSRQAGAREVRRTSAERAVLVGLGPDDQETASRMAELTELVRSAGATVAATVVQRRPKPDHRTVVGEGKLQEAVSLAFHEDADLLAFDRE